MNGFVIFYLNHDPEKQKGEDLIRVMRQENKDLFDALNQDGYGTCLVLTTEEATRVEKVDYAHPFPRFVPGMIKMDPDRIISKNEETKK